MSEPTWDRIRHRLFGPDWIFAKNQDDQMAFAECEQIVLDAIKQTKIDTLRHAAELCCKVSPRCGELKDKAIRDCIKVIYAEADKLTTP